MCVNGKWIEHMNKTTVEMLNKIICNIQLHFYRCDGVPFFHSFIFSLTHILCSNIFFCSFRSHFQLISANFTQYLRWKLFGSFNVQPKARQQQIKSINFIESDSNTCFVIDFFFFFIFSLHINIGNSNYLTITLGLDTNMWNKRESEMKKRSIISNVNQITVCFSLMHWWYQCRVRERRNNERTVA